MKTSEALKKAKALIEAGWTKREFAIYEGMELFPSMMVGELTEPPMYPEGTCFCIVGAVRAACNEDIGMYRRMRDAVDKVANTKGGTVVSFNDYPETTKDDVLAFFDQAIEAKELLND